MSESSMFTYSRGPKDNALDEPKFDILNPVPEAIRLPDIAWGLAGTYRFNAQSPLRKSVAEHCLEVADYFDVEEFPLCRMWALLHDAAEAYTGDFIHPYKHLVTINGKSAAEIEEEILQTIAVAFELPYPTTDEWKEIKVYDELCGSLDVCSLWKTRNPRLVGEGCTTTYFYHEWMREFDNCACMFNPTAK